MMNLGQLSQASSPHMSAVADKKDRQEDKRARDPALLAC